MAKTLIAFLLLIAQWRFCNAQITQDTSKRVSFFNTIVIDPGHGGKDPGARGDYSREKDVALSIGLKLRTVLHSTMPELKVLMTRSTDTFIELNKRADIANKSHANLFISIHCNSSPEGTARSPKKLKGPLVLLYGYHRKEEQVEAVRENAAIYQESNYQQNYQQYNDPTAAIILNSYMQKYRRQSIKFAELIISEFENHDNRQSFGVKEQGLLVLAHSGMPAVLIETGFINNPEEEEYLNSNDGQEEIVQSIVRAIVNYKKLIDSN